MPDFDTAGHVYNGWQAGDEGDWEGRSGQLVKNALAL